MYFILGAARSVVAFERDFLMYNLTSLLLRIQERES